MTYQSKHRTKIIPNLLSLAANLYPAMHEHFMRLALAQAEQALHEDEVPIGAVVVSQERIIASGTTNGNNSTIPPRMPR